MKWGKEDTGRGGGGFAKEDVMRGWRGETAGKRKAFAEDGRTGAGGGRRIPQRGSCRREGRQKTQHRREISTNAETLGTKMEKTHVGKNHNFNGKEGGGEFRARPGPLSEGKKKKQGEA